MRKALGSVGTILLATLLASTLIPGTALAHERRNVGKYQLVVGFIVEPAFEGQKNGVELRVTDTETNLSVEGLEKTLKVEVTHGGASRIMDLRTIFRDPGHYTADFIPTASGQYIFRFFGTIEAAQINERFESGPGRFDEVKSGAALYFPEAQPSLAELQKALALSQGQGALAEQRAQLAEEQAGTARNIAIGGAVLGALGVILGGISLAAKRPSADR